MPSLGWPGGPQPWDRSRAGHRQRPFGGRASGVLPWRAHPGPQRIIALSADETPRFQDQADRLHRQFRPMGIASETLPQPGRNQMTVVPDLDDPDRPLGQRLAALEQDSRTAPLSL